MLNNHGEIRHPCLTPLCTSNQSVVSSPTFTAASLSLYRPCTALNSLPRTPYCFKASHSPALHTPSYALSRSKRDYIASVSALLATCIQDLEDIFLKFPSAEACFRDELRDVVCKLLIAEAPDPTKSGLEAGTLKLGFTRQDDISRHNTYCRFTSV